MSCISASAASVARASVAPSARASAARRGASVAPMRAARVNVVAAVDLNGASRRAFARPARSSGSTATRGASADPGSIARGRRSTAPRLPLAEILRPSRR